MIKVTLQDQTRNKNIPSHRPQGSMVNYLNTKRYYPNAILKVGTGATINMWSDRHPATVVEIIELKNGRTYIKIQEDNAERIDNNGYSESQEYIYSPNLNGRIYFAEVIKVFAEDMKGFDVKTEGFILIPAEYNYKTKRFNKGYQNISIGHRSKYWDPSF